MLNISKIHNFLKGVIDVSSLSPIEESIVKSIPTYGASVISSLVALSYIKSALTKKSNDSLEYKLYLGAKSRKKRYSNRYEIYQKRLDFVYLHNKIFTSSYGVYLYKKTTSSFDSLKFAMNDIYTYEAFEKAKK